MKRIALVATLIYCSSLLGAPSLEERLYSRARQQHTHGDLNTALETYQELLTHNPDHLRARLFIGIIYYEINHLERAFACFQTVIKKHPHCASAHVYLGMCYAHKKKYASGLQHLNKALSIEPRNAHALTQRGILLHAAGHLHHAYLSLQKARRYSPDNIQTCSAMGDLCTELEKWDEALECYLTIVKRDPHNIRAQRALAKSYWRIGNLEQSATIYRTALALDPDDETLCYELSCVLEELDHLEA